MKKPDSQEAVFWLLRHPQPEASTIGRCYGSLDVPLSELGVRHARQLAAALAIQEFVAIYTSPARRCRRAAAILASTRGIPVTAVDALRELDFGEFEGHTYEEIATSNPELYAKWMQRPTEVQFPGGESFGQMRQRVLQVVKELHAAHLGQSVALVTHGGVIRVLLADALGIPPSNIFRLCLYYGSINVIRYINEVPIVDLMNAEVVPI